MGSREGETVEVADGSGDGGIKKPAFDRSRVRILLCDKDTKSSEEVLSLLTKCSYQVTAVRTARHVINFLNAQGPDVDIILAEVDLPTRKGLKMLKYITRNQELRRIPIIMMSSQDDVSVIVKCLRLGAADYLVKPLRTNELLNLWMHMWRRRRMLGLAEKDVFGQYFDLVVSDPSDANTNSTTMLSEDTDEKSRKMNPEASMSNCEDESHNLGNEHGYSPLSSENLPIVEASDNAGKHFFSIPKKTNLKIGESSAFFTYVKSSTQSGISKVAAFHKESYPKDPSISQVNNSATTAEENPCFGKSANGEKLPDMNSFPADHHTTEDFSSSTSQQTPQSNPWVVDASNPLKAAMFQIPVFLDTPKEQSSVPMPPHMYRTFPNGAHPAMLDQYNALCQYSHMQTIVPAFHYFPTSPVNVTLPNAWPPAATSGTSVAEMKISGRSERREAALMKFRQKRKDRCFNKKVRYVNRKKLAEKRPRVRGQFVRRASEVDNNPIDDSDDNDDEDRGEELEPNSSPERFS